MPTIENYSEHPFHFPKGIQATEGQGPLSATASAYEEGLIFPRAGDKGDDGNRIPSRTRVSDEQLATMKGHRVARGWFNRNGLLVSDKDAPAFDPKNEDAMGAPVKAKPRQ